MDFLLPSGNKKILGSETKKRVYQANLSRGKGKGVVSQAFLLFKGVESVWRIWKHIRGTKGKE